MKPFTIGKVAKTTDVGVETIRFYERRGLIAQPKRPKGGGARDYDADTVARLRFIRQAKDIGFPWRRLPSFFRCTTTARLAAKPYKHAPLQSAGILRANSGS